MGDRFSNQLKRIIEQPDKDSKLLFDEVRQLVHEHEIEHQETDIDGTLLLNDLFSNQLALNELLDSVTTLESGFEELDDKGVFCTGEYVVFGGRPAMGKTQLLVNLAMNMSVHVPVLYLSFDLSSSAIMKRMISNLTGIELEKIRLGKVNDLEKKLINSMENEFSQRKLFVNDSAYSNVSYVRELCRKHIERDGVKVIVIDHLQLLGTNRYRHNREMEMSYVSRSLKTLARQNDVLILVASQLSRSVELRGGDKRPLLSDLRESGAIEQDADKVFFVYRPEYYGLMQDEEGNSTAGLTELILAKNRSGHLDRFLFNRDDNFTHLTTFKGYLEHFRIDNNRAEELDDTPF